MNTSMKQNTNRLTDTEDRPVVAKGEVRWGKEGLGTWDQQMQTSIYGMDKQQGPTVQHREISISCDKPEWKI